MQTLPEQVPPWHELSQPPQLFGSEVGSTQPVSQQSSPEMHSCPDAGQGTPLHTPPEHVEPVEHTVPQVPQLSGSVWVSEQVAVPFDAAQHACPVTHCACPPQVQLPLVHSFAAVMSHVVAQPPQFSVSVDVSTQNDSLPNAQQVAGAAQLVGQEPVAPASWPFTTLSPLPPQDRENRAEMKTRTREAVASRTIVHLKRFEEVA